MGNRQTLGIVTILAGTLLVIGAVRGTWQRLFKDVVLGQQDPVGGGASAGGAVGAGVNQVNASGGGIGAAVAANTPGVPAGGAIGEIIANPGAGVQSNPPAQQDAFAAARSMAAGVLMPFVPSNTPPSPAPGIAGSIWRQAGA